MTSDQTTARATEILRALADPDRLAVFSRCVLAGPDGAAVADLAEASGLSARDVAAAVGRLSGAGLVEATSGRIAARIDPLVEASAAMAKAEPDEALAAAGGDRELAGFFRGGRLGALPRKPALAVRVLDHVSETIPEDADLTEADVTGRLAEVCEDPVTVRRALVDRGLLVRDPAGSRYRLIRGGGKTRPVVPVT